MDVPTSRDSFADAKAEAEAFKNATLEEHFKAFSALCAFSDAVLENHPEREKLIQYRDPLPEQSTRHLQALIRATANRSK